MKMLSLGNTCVRAHTHTHTFPPADSGNGIMYQQKRKHNVFVHVLNGGKIGPVLSLPSRVVQSHLFRSVSATS